MVCQLFDRIKVHCKNTIQILELMLTILICMREISLCQCRTCRLNQSTSPAAPSASRAQTFDSGSNLCLRKLTMPTKSSQGMRLNNLPLHLHPSPAFDPSPSQFQTRARNTRPLHRPPQLGPFRCRTRVPPRQTPIGSSTHTLSIVLEAPAR